MTMNVSVFGLGYVGCVSAACFAREGNTVLGVDVNQAKVDMINSGKSTILEEGINELVHDMVGRGALRATTSAREAVMGTSVSLVCVGTPSRANGSIDTRYLERVCTEIGAALRDKAESHTVVIRSTVMPGTIESTLVPILEESSGKRSGTTFHVASNPEFLREGTSIRDFDDPPFTIIGTGDSCAADALKALYARLQAPLYVTPIRVAEMVKYACNCFHGLKVGFANEIGNVCKALDIDSHEVMKIFVADTKLNVSPAYLRPGFAFGGSCLPKDLRAITYKARQVDVDTPILSAVLESNKRQITRAYDMIAADGRRRIGVLGMAFKAGTDDLRESPIVSLIETLIGRGMQVTVYDRDVSSANVMGANRDYVEREIPHIWSLMRGSVDEVLAGSDVIVIGNASREFREIDGRLREGQVVIDLVRAFGTRTSEGPAYQGICW